MGENAIFRQQIADLPVTLNGNLQEFQEKMDDHYDGNIQDLRRNCRPIALPGQQTRSKNEHVQEGESSESKDDINAD